MIAVDSLPPPAARRRGQLDLARSGRAGTRPGAQFDEKVPGTGLGFAIVLDLASLDRGSIALGSSGLGGLRADLTLPAG